MASGEELASSEELCRQLEKLKEENLLLMRDIENMCLQGSESMFSSSFVVSERIYSLETELVKAKSELRAVTAERNSLREDGAQLRKAKRDVDSSWREERARADKLEKELDFYQKQSLQAIAERDDVLVEIEEARRGNLSLEGRLREARGEAEREGRQRRDLQDQLEKSREEVGSLRSQVSELSQLADVKKQLDDIERELEQERKKNSEAAEANKSLAVEIEGLGRMLAGKTKEAEELEKRLQEATSRSLNMEVQHKHETEKLTGLLRSAESAADEAEANREEYEDSLYAARAEVEVLRKAASHAAQARDAAYEELKEAQANFKQEIEGMNGMAEQCNDLKTRLALATQEKVETIMKLAEQKQENQNLQDKLRAGQAKK